MDEFWFACRRIWMEVLGMIIIGILLFVLKLSDTTSVGLALFMYKALLFSASQVHAMATRKFFFPYIDFRYANIGAQSMVIALHLAAAYVYSQGG